MCSDQVSEVEGDTDPLVMTLGQRCVVEDPAESEVHLIFLWLYSASRRLALGVPDL
jgi:hypothetical protein